MDTPLPNAPAEPSSTYEPKKSGLPDDAVEGSLPPKNDEEPGEADELDPDDPVGTPASPPLNP